MKNVIYFLAILTLVFTSCSKDDDVNFTAPVVTLPQSADLVVGRAVNISAQQSGGFGQPISGDFAKYDVENGEETTSDTEWDIAFRGTTILVNGGVVTGATDEPLRNGEAAALVVSSTFNQLLTAEGLTFTQDADGSTAIPTGSGNGWYTYAGPPTHEIFPTPGEIIVIKTRSGNYAKIEIESYYLNSDNTQQSRNYTFDFVYNPNVGDKKLQ